MGLQKALHLTFLIVNSFLPALAAAADNFRSRLRYLVAKLDTVFVSQKIPLRRPFGFILVCAFLTSVADANGSVTSQCSQFYFGKPKITDFISPKKMKQSGFKAIAEKNGRVWLYTLEKKPVLLGELKLLEVPHLFEWKDRSRHEMWVKNKGLSSEDLTRHFYTSHNWLEKGFCVSTHISDSAHYGDTLTVFPSQGPMLVFVPGAASKNVEITGTPEGTIQLQSAGIDAVYIGKGTWYAVIQDKHLKNPTGVNAKAIVESTRSLADAVELAMRGNGKWLDRIKFWELLPRDHILHRIYLGKKITREEKLMIGSLIRERKFPARTSNPGVVEIFFYEQALPLYIDHLRATADVKLSARIESFMRYYGRQDAQLE